MAHISSPTMTVETNKGECKLHIILELNINLNGDVSVGAVKAVDKTLPAAKAKEDETAWVIPDFTSGAKIDFGKKE